MSEIKEAIYLYSGPIPENSSIPASDDALLATMHPDHTRSDFGNNFMCESPVRSGKPTFFRYHYLEKNRGIPACLQGTVGLRGCDMNLSFREVIKGAPIFCVMRIWENCEA